MKLAMEEKFKDARAADRPQESKQQQLVNVDGPLNEGRQLINMVSVFFFFSRLFIGKYD